MIMEPGISDRQSYETIVATHSRLTAMSACDFADCMEVAKLQALGAGQSVKKPYTIEELETVVQLALR